MSAKMNVKLKESIVRALSDDDLRNTLELIIRRESALRKQWPDKREWWMWRVSETGAEWNNIKKLITLGLVEVAYSSSRARYYRLVNYDVVKKALDEWYKSMDLPQSQLLPTKAQKIPQDLFDIIEGHDELKWIFKKSLTAERYHILLVGPPASGKTMFLLEISRIPGAIFVDVPHATRVGIRDLILEYRPRYLLLDELDKATNKDFLNALGNIMEIGKVVATKYKEYTNVEVAVNIYATANTKRTIPEHILSRFDVYEMPPYTDEELMRVIVRLLTKRYKKPKGLAEAIAYAVVHELSSRDPRDAVRVAKIVDSIDDLKTYIKLKKKYSRRFRVRRER